MLASLVWGVTPPASAAIGYTGHIGSALNMGCPTPWTIVTAAEDNFVDQSEPGAVQTPGHADIHTRSKVGDVDRAFVKFPMPAVPSGCELDTAWIDLEVQTYASGRTIEAARAASSWSESAITWNNQPAATGTVTSAPSQSGDMDIPVTPQVNEIYAGTNDGFILRDAAENDGGDQRNHYYSSESAGNEPQLIIWWQPINRTSVSVTVGASGVPAGNSVVLSFGMEESAGAISASDSQGNVYSLDRDVSNPGDVRGAILSAHDVKELGPGDTITVTHPDANARGFAAFAFSGIDPANPRDGTGAGQGVSSTPTSSGAAVGQANELVFGSITAGTNSFTRGTGFTSLPQVGDSGGSVNSEYKIVSSPGTYVANGTLGSSTEWTALAANYRLDVTAPTVAITSPAGGSSTNDTTPAIGGTSGSYNSDSQTVTARIRLGLGTGGPVVQTLNATRAPDGTWTIDANTLAEGIYTVQATQTDGAGNTGTSPPVSFTIDTGGPPAPTMDSVPTDGSSTSPSWSFSGEAGNTFECRLNKGATQISGWGTCTSPKSYNLTDGDGTYTFSVRQIDAALNVSPVTTDDYVLDTVAPETTINSGPNGPTGNPDATFTFSSNDPSATFECQIDSGGYSACTSPLTYLGLTDGPHSFQVRAVDPVGNTDATPANRDFDVNTTLPGQPTLSGPAVDPDDDDTPTWTFSGEPTATFECKLEKNGSIESDWAPCTSPQTPTLSGDGDFTFSVRQTTVAGTSEPASDNYTLDMTDPDAPTLNGPNPDPGRITTGQWTFSGETGAVIECRLEKGALVIQDWTNCASPESHSLVDGDGTYAFNVRQTDAAGNTSPVATDTYDLDATAPETTIDNGPSGLIETPDTTFEFSSDDPTATFECNLDDAGYAPCASPMDITGLADGGHVFEVRAVDPVGNDDPSPAAAAFVIDTGAPIEPTIEGPPSPSNDDTPSWDLTGEEGATFECKLEKGGVVLSDWLSCGTPVTYTMTDGDGTYTLFVRQIDLAGNPSPAATSDYTYDTMAPDAPTIVSPSPNPGNLTVPSWDFDGEPNANFDCQLEKDGVVLEPFSNCLPPELYGLSDGDGDYVFTVRQIDVAGNVSPTASDTYTLDTAAPETSIDTGPAGTVATANVTFTFSSDDPSATFECNLDGSGFTTCSSPQDYDSLADGDHTFQVRALDAAGNVDDTPAEQLFTSDTQAPTLTIDSRPNDPGNDPSPTWTFSSEESPVTFECQLDGPGGPVAPWEPCDAETMTYDLSTSPDETYTFRVRVSDGVGNTAVRTDTYLYDTAKPDSTAMPPASVNTVTFTVNYSSGDPGGSGVDLVELWVKGPQDADFRFAGTDNTPNSPSFDFTSDQGDGVYHFYTRALDKAGNQQDVPGGQGSTTVDTTAPVVAITGSPSSPWTSTEVVYSFSVNDPEANAECSLTADGSVSYAPCSSPVTYQIGGVGDYTFNVRAVDPAGNASNTVTHTFTSEGEPSPTPSDSPSPTPTEEPSPTPSDSPSPTPSDSPSPTPSDDPSPTPSNSPSPTPSESPSPTPSNSPSPTPSESPSPTPSEEPSPTPTKEPSPTPTKSPRPTPTDEPTDEPTRPPETPAETPTQPVESPIEDAPITEPPSGGSAPPTVSGPYSDPEEPEGPKDDGDPDTPVVPGGIVQTPAPEGPADAPDADRNTRVLGHETQLEKLGRYAVEAVQKFAFPLILALAVVAFLAVQHWMDRKTPKLAFAPVHSRYDQVGFE